MYFLHRRIIVGVVFVVIMCFLTASHMNELGTAPPHTTPSSPLPPSSTSHRLTSNNSEKEEQNVEKNPDQTRKPQYLLLDSNCPRCASPPVQLVDYNAPHPNRSVLMKRFASQPTQFPSLDHTTPVNQKRVFFVGDSLVRYLYAAFANRVVKDGLVKASTASPFSSSGQPAQGQRRDPLMLEGAEGKSFPHLSWPPSHVPLDSDSGPIIKLRSEADQYISKSKRWKTKGILDFNPTHIVVNRGSWDAEFMQPRSPRKTLLSFSDGLVTARTSFDPSVPIIVYGIHRIHRRRVKTALHFCVWDDIHDQYTDAIFCAVRRANGILEEMERKEKKDLGRIHYFDTFSVTAQVDGHKAARVAPDGIHYQKEAMERLVDELLGGLTDIDFQSTAKNTLQLSESKVDLVTLPEPLSAQCLHSIDVKNDKAECVDVFETSWAQGFFEDIANSYKKVSYLLQKSHKFSSMPTSSTSSCSKLESAANCPWQKPHAVAAVYCSEFLGKVFKTYGSIDELLEQPKGMSPASFRGVKECREFLDNNITNPFFHSVLLKMTHPSARFSCHDATFVAFWQTDKAVDPVAFTDLETHACHVAIYYADKMKKVLHGQMELMLSQGAIHCPNYITLIMTYFPAEFWDTPVTELFMEEREMHTHRTQEMLCLSIIGTMNATTFLEKVQWNELNCPGLARLLAGLKARGMTIPISDDQLKGLKTRMKCAS